MAYASYKIEGASTAKTYYGYLACEQSDDHEAVIMSKFLIGATRKTGERGDIDMLDANAGDPSTLVVADVVWHDTEVEAWGARNYSRAVDPFAVTGPTLLPLSISKQVDQSERSKWSLNTKQRTAKTARDAYALKAWTFDQIKQANVDATDLDKMHPTQFASKYNLAFNLGG